MSPAQTLSDALTGRYRVDRQLGVGGMATVYLAHDLRHDRDVAIKVLHPDLGAALGGERFLSEIKTTARLQHPHILPLLDSGDAGGVLYYVMPLATGETLRDRLMRERQLPIDDAVRIAREVADAVQFAHAAGIIHRDIKPENILLQGGHALVADFGIALAVQTVGGARMTQTGLSLGTPQYMSPEQAMGERTIDARSDIYALGAVLYEMLTGDPPFTGSSVQAIVAKVLTEKPTPPSVVRDTIPLGVEQTVLRSLAKLPADRFATAAEFAAALTSGERATVGPVPVPRSRRPALTLPAVAAAFVVIAALSFMIGRGTARGDDTNAEPITASLVPEAEESWSTNGVAFSVSPNGRRVVIRSGDSLVIRSLDSLRSQRVPNTTDATFPFWSPDGRSIGFFADNQLRTVDLSTGSVRALCPATLPMGGTWAQDGTILFTPDRASGLHVTAASGGGCQKLNVAQPQTSLGSRPYFFPDGKHFLATTDLAAYIGEIGGDSLRHLVNLPRMRAVLGPPDFLLYSPDGSPPTSIFAQRIDVGARKLVGAPVKLLDRVPRAGGNTSLSASSNGVLVARVGRDQGQRYISLVTRGGQARDTVRLGNIFGAFQRSRDGRRLALGGFQLDLLDLERRVTSTLIKPTTNRWLFQYPQWSPGDTAIAYMFRDSVNARIDVVDVRTGITHTLVSGFPPGRFPYLADWSADGRYIVYTLTASGSEYQEPWVYDLSTKQSRKLFDERGNVGPMQISPNGRFITYEVISGELYLRPFPGPGSAVRVTPDVGRFPDWRGDGRELFYVNEAGAIVAVGIREDGTVASTSEIAVAASVTRDLTSNAGSVSFEPAIDGKQFHIVYNRAPDAPALAIMTNWWKRAGFLR